MKDTNGNIISNKKNTFTFDSHGNLISPKNVTLSSPQQIKIDFNLTSYQKTDNGSSYMYSQNGIEKGFLQRYDITDDGKINALFSNSQISTLGQIPVFHFQNEQGLETIGGNLFRETDNSNKAFLYTDKQGNYISGAKILSNKLETSNVNMSQAMTELIITQKAFSASAKTVTTSDQMIQRAIDMKKG